MVWQIKSSLKNGPTATIDGFTDKMREVIEADFKNYPTKRPVILKALHMVQDEYKYVSDKAMIDIAKLIDISPAEVLDTMSFYEMYTREKRGKYDIGVCVSLSCELCGCHKVKNMVKEIIGAAPGETTEDGKYSVFDMECIGACEFAPAVLINHKLFKVEDKEQLKTLIENV